MRGLSDTDTYYSMSVSYFSCVFKEEKGAYIFRITWRSEHHLIVKVINVEIPMVTKDSL